MREKEVWPALAATRPTHVVAHRIETGRTALGVPDVLFFTKLRVGWIENKTAIQKDGRLVLREELGFAQAEFVNAAHHAGCVAVVAVWWQSGSNYRWLVVSGSEAHRLVGLKSLPMAVCEWRGVLGYGTLPSLRAAAYDVWALLT